MCAPLIISGLAACASPTVDNAASSSEGGAASGSDLTRNPAPTRNEIPEPTDREPGDFGDADNGYVFVLEDGATACRLPAGGEGDGATAECHLASNGRGGPNGTLDALVFEPGTGIFSQRISGGGIGALIGDTGRGAGRAARDGDSGRGGNGSGSSERGGFERGRADETGADRTDGDATESGDDTDSPAATDSREEATTTPSAGASDDAGNADDRDRDADRGGDGDRDNATDAADEDGEGRTVAATLFSGERITAGGIACTALGGGDFTCTMGDDHRVTVRGGDIQGAAHRGARPTGETTRMARNAPDAGSHREGERCGDITSEVFDHIDGPLVVTVGTVDCAEIRPIVQKYVDTPLDSGNGNWNVRQYGNWTCSMPTAATIEREGNHVTCGDGTGNAVAVKARTDDGN